MSIPAAISPLLSLAERSAPLPELAGVAAVGVPTLLERQQRRAGTTEWDASDLRQLPSALPIIRQREQHSSLRFCTRQAARAAAYTVVQGHQGCLLLLTGAVVELPLPAAPLG
jgi:hypothetical protein